MIRYLHLSNFRRHAETEINFDEGGQIILIGGHNGVGKSTVIEAITYALYGEGRHGVRNLDQMIRRGAEYEGMEVEMEFDLAGTIYRVKRRRDNRISSAVLWGNDVALVEGSREVTAEISQLLGMDARGFRLAVVAQQKELDGLASMRPAERASTLARLLRLDVVTQARDRARGVFRSERDALRGMGSVESSDGVQGRITDLEEMVAGLTEAKSSSETAIDAIDARLTEAVGVEAAWQAASAQHARLEALAHSADAEVTRLEGDMAKIVLGDEPGELPNLDELAERTAAVERQIAQAEANSKLASQASMVAGELDGVEKRISQLELEKQGLQTVDEAADQKAVAELEGQLDGATERREALLADHSTAKAAVASLEARLGELQGLEATCGTCGQEISDEHKHDQLSSTEQAIEDAREKLATVTAMGRSVNEEIETIKAALSTARTQLEEGKKASARKVAIDDELFDLGRRRSTYRDQLERISVEDVDLDELMAQRGTLAIEAAAATAAHEAARLRELALERKRGLEETLRSALLRREQAAGALAAGQISEELEAAHQALEVDRQAKLAEQALVAELVTQLAVAEEQLRSERRELVRLTKQHERRSKIEHDARVASSCAEVLDSVATRLNQQIRPALEGAVGELLSRLSDGRFDAVQLDEDYNVSVRDGGDFRPLGEFSGGEIDLIALAMRLALASVVSERHGSGGAGFLILDECFGSQDQERRGSILTALRGLKGVYGQILLISHVGGIEDSADRVIEIEMDEETGIASAVFE